MNSILLKEPVKRAEKSLKEFDTNLNIIILEHTARTANDAATALGCKVGAIVKSLLFKTDDTFSLCLIAGDKRVSLNKLKRIINKKDVSMSSADEVKKITGFTIGSVTPVGHINNLTSIIDSSLERFENLYAAAGHPNCVFKINFSNLKKITNGSIKNIAE